jgi:tetratricopeptide (TPR) repeat protein
MLAINRFTLLGLILCLAISACSSPQEKRDSFMAKGEKLEAGKDYVRARLEFKNAIKVDPQCVDCYAGLARVEIALKNFREAYAAYYRAVDLAPERMDIQLALGQLLLLGRSADKAEEKARFIISKEPDNQNAQILLAMALTFQKDKREEALDLLKKIRNDYPARPEGYILAAKILSSQGYISKAESILRKGIENSQEPRPFLQAILSIYLQQRDWDSVLDVAKELESLAPDEARSHQMLAQIYEQRGEIDLAKEAWQKALDKEPDNSLLVLALSQFWLRQQKYSEAETVLREALGKNPEVLELRLALARLLTITGRGSDALDVLEPVQEKDISKLQRTALLNEKARILYYMGKLDRSENLVSEILKENPKNPSALLIQARIALVRREGALAVTALRTLLDDAPDNNEYRILLAQAHLINKEFKLAEDQLRRATQKNPKDQRAWQALVKLYLLEKDLNLAQNTINDALNAVPDSAVVYELQGRVQWLKGDNLAAEKSFRKAIELNPNWLIPYRDLASILAKSDKLDEAEKGLKDAVAKYPKAWNLKILLANFYEQTGQAKSAIYVYEGLIKDMPEHPLIYNNLAYLYTEYYDDKEHLAQAKDLIERALSKLPGDISILDTQAWILFKSGEPKKALEVIEAADANVQNPTLLYHKGVVLIALGEKEKARKALQQALEDEDLFPERDKAQKLLTDL